jgi:SAM-dependent methyltransferase
MKVFKDYANYYDLFYEHKDYAKEVDYINRIIKKNNSEAKKILDLGCGTGRHLLHFAKYGYNIHGVDQSKTMLSIAKKNCQIDKNSNIKLINGDIRNIELSQKFDVVVSLFHVLSYQITNSDLRSTFDVVKKCLSLNGLFIFDCWYGPAVLNLKPLVRVSRFSSNGKRIIRITEPVTNYSTNIVEVNYQILIIDDKTNKTEEISEKHKMRYFFIPEIELFSGKDFKIIFVEEFLTGKEPSVNTWGVCFVLKRIK